MKNLNEKSDNKLLCRDKKDESRQGLAHLHRGLKDPCSFLPWDILFLVTAQWEFPLQQPMKCYCIIIHL